MSILIPRNCIQHNEDSSLEDLRELFVILLIVNTKIGLLGLFSLFCAFTGRHTLICNTVGFGASSGTNCVDNLSDFFNTYIIVT
jgi:hypothetical protein